MPGGLVRQLPSLKKALYNQDRELLYDKMVIVNEYESDNIADVPLKTATR